MHVLRFVAGGVFSVFVLALGAQAQGTAFSHQGFLTEAGESANGVYDLHFTVFDAASGGTAQAASNLVSALPISNGLFTVTLDYGTNVFTGAARWLETAVRTNGGASFTTLTPRQPLLASPYAMHAGRMAVTGLVGSITSAQIGALAISNGHLAVAVQTNITARLGSNTWALAGSTTNYVRRTGDTMGGILTLSNSVETIERLRLNGQEFYDAGVSSADGIAFLIGVNRADNRQLWIADSARLTENASNGVVRIVPALAPASALIDAVGTDGVAPLPLGLGPNHLLHLGTNRLVGVGTTTPADLLHVAATGAVRVRIESTGTNYAGLLTKNPNGEWFLGVDPAAGAGTFELYQNSSPGGLRLAVTTNGYVGIGTATPAAKLTVPVAGDTDRGLQVTDGTTNGNVIIQALTGGNSGFAAINFNGYFDGSEQRFNTTKARWRMYADQRATEDIFVLDRYDGTTLKTLVVLTNGFTGIGTATPGAMLHVVGNEIVSGVVTASAFSGSGAQLTGVSGGQLTAGTVSNTHLATAVQTNITARLASNTWAAAGSTTNYTRRTGDTMTGALNLPAGGLTVGTSQLVVTATAKVGIGITAPVAGLHVSNNVAFDTARIESSHSGGTWLSLRNAAGGHDWSIIASGSGNTEGAGHLLIRDNTEGTVRQTILTNGFVGLGTVAPVVPLDVSQASPGHLMQLNNTAGEDGIAGLTFSSTNQFMGQIGYVGTNNQIGYAGSGDLILGSYNGADLRFDASPGGFEALRMMIKADSGFVGIGTDVPTEELSIAGDLFFTRNAARSIYVGMEPDNSTDAKNLTITAGAASSSGVPFQARKGGDLILAAGNGYNANIAGKDGGDVIIRSGANWYTGTTDPGGDIVFQTGYITNSFIERMRITEDGFLGIGNTNPLAVLHVVGNEIVSGVVTASAFSGSGAQLTGLSGGQLTAGTVSNTHLATAVQTNITARLASNTWAAAGSTTNYVRRTGETMSGALNLPAGGLAVGTTQLVVTASGFVGIGTATPAAKLTVPVTSDADRGLQVTDGTTNGNVIIQALTGGNSGFAAINFNGYFDGSEQRINTTKARWRMYVDQRATEDVFVLDRYDGTTLKTLVVLTNGFTGISTATPGAMLHVVGNEIVSGVVTASAFSGSGAQLTGISGGQLTAGTVSNTHLATAVQTNITARLASNTWAAADATTNYVRRTGDVVGGLLVLSNSVQFSERLRLNGQEYYGAGNASSNGLALLMGVNRTDNRQLWIADSARLGFSPTNSVVRISPGTGDTGAIIDAIGTDGATPLPLRLGNGPAIYLGSNSLVGVGTTTPGAKLHVIGNEIVSGVVTALAFVGSGAGLSDITVTNTVITNKLDKTGDTMTGALTIDVPGNVAATLVSASTLGSWIVLQNTSSGGTTHDIISTGSGNGEGAGKLLFRRGGNVAMTISTNGYVGIGTVSPTGLLHVAGNAYATAWLTSSDRNAKENVAAVDVQDILARIMALPVSQWSFKSETGVRHIGPMAQDFHAAFGLGPSETAIATVDADGVALAAIQGLKQEKDAEIAALRKRNDALERELAELRSLIEKIAAPTK